MPSLTTRLHSCSARPAIPGRAIDAADVAAHLSPLDPMMFGTHRVRTFALLRLGKVQEAADRAKLVGQNAGDHVHAHAVSALTLAAAGRIEEARAGRRRISELRPDYNFRQFKGASYARRSDGYLPKGREVTGNPRVNAPQNGSNPTSANLARIAVVAAANADVSA